MNVKVIIVLVAAFCQANAFVVGTAPSTGGFFGRMGYKVDGALSGAFSGAANAINNVGESIKSGMDKVEDIQKGAKNAFDSAIATGNNQAQQAMDNLLANVGAVNNKIADRVKNGMGKVEDMQKEAKSAFDNIFAAGLLNNNQAIDSLLANAGAANKDVAERVKNGMGKLEDMQKEAKSAFDNIFAAGLLNNNQAIDSLLANAGAANKDVAERVKNGMGKLEDMQKDAKNTFDNIFATIQQGNNYAEQTIESMLANAMRDRETTILNKINELKNSVNVDQIANQAQAVMDEMKGKMGMEQIAKQVEESARNALEKMKLQNQAIMEEIKKIVNVEEFAKHSEAMAREAMEELKTKTSAALDNVKTKVDIKQFIEQAKAMAADTTKQFESNIKAVMEGFLNQMENGKKQARDSITEVKAMVANLQGEAKEKYTAVVNKLEENVEEISEKVTQFVDAINKKIRAQIEGGLQKYNLGIDQMIQSKDGLNSFFTNTMSGMKVPNVNQLQSVVNDFKNEINIGTYMAGTKGVFDDIAHQMAEAVKQVEAIKTELKQEIA